MDIQTIIDSEEKDIKDMLEAIKITKGQIEKLRQHIVNVTSELNYKKGKLDALKMVLNNEGE